jgi:hypothetical protein
MTEQYPQQQLTAKAFFAIKLSNLNSQISALHNNVWFWRRWLNRSTPRNKRTALSKSCEEEEFTLLLWLAVEKFQLSAPNK